MKKILVFTLFILFSEAVSATSNLEVNSARRDSCTLVFSGDLMLHMPQINSAKQQDSTFSFDHYFTYLAPIWKSADFAIVNFESTISHDGLYAGYPAFSSPKEILESLKSSGVDIVALANNHILDRGYKGIISTLKAVQEAELQSVGIVVEDSTCNTNISILEKGEFRVALLNYTYGTNGIRAPRHVALNMIDTSLIKADIKDALEQKATHIVTFFHWGNEYQTHASIEQKELAMWCKQQGVDVVIGSHPHVVQQIDVVNSIVYSLGNLVSNQTKMDRDCGLTVEVILYSDSKDIKIIPTTHWTDWKREDKKLRYQIVTEEHLDKSSNSQYMKYAVERVKRRVY